MRVTKCPQCGKEQVFEVRTHNSGGYQYQAEIGKKCGHEIGLIKKPIPEWFDKARRKKLF